MSSSRLDISMSISARPDERIADLCHVLQMLADAWPGVRVIDECLYTRRSGDAVFTTDKILQMRGVLRDSNDRYVDAVLEHLVQNMSPSKTLRNTLVEALQAGTKAMADIA